MSTELVTQNHITVEEIDSYLKAMNTSLSSSEVTQFRKIAQAYGLNPFKREIYVSKFGNNFSIIVGFETYLKRAERSGLLAGWTVETQGLINSSDVAKSDITAVIKIHRKDWTHPFIHSVHFSEYVQKKSDGTVNKFWREKPMTMIKKVAMAQGFRLCFPDENGGLPYTSEELGAEPIYDAEVLESSPVVVDNVSAAKRGRPKKEVPVINVASVKSQIDAVSNVNDLKKLWEAHPGIKNYPELVDAFSVRKASILEAGKIEAKKAEIDAATTEDEIWSIVEKETNAEILAYANVRINAVFEKLTAKTTNNELF